MPYYLAFVLSAESIDAISDSLEVSTEFTREGHESSYIGVYDLFRIPEKLMVKYNFVEDENEWDYPEHKDRDIVVVAEQTERPEYIEKLVQGLGIDAVLVERKEW